MIRKVLEFRKELVALLLLFSVALGLRLLYQQESVVSNPLRADAGKYFSAAYNLHQYRVYSLEPPRKDLSPPNSRTDLSPGYPLFLTLLMDDRALDHVADFVVRVLRVQAVMGSLVIVFTFLTARLFLDFGWAFTAGVFTACNPHLIAIDGFFLSESTFIFLLMLGMLLLSLAWKSDRWAITLVASLLLAASAQVRAVSYLLVFFIAPMFLIVRGKPTLSIKATWIRHVTALALGFFLIIGTHREFVKLTVTHEPNLLGAVTENGGLQEQRQVPQKYVVFQSPWAYLKTAVRPPRFYVEQKSHVFVENRDRHWKLRSDASVRKEFLAYLKWNLVGKFVILWHWDNAYNGDVYIYPMIRRGFDEHQFLRLLHGIMKTFHWPVFALSMAAPVVLFVQWRNTALPATAYPVLIPVLGFVYFIAVLWVLSWLPRYTIPVRPLSFLIAAYSLSSITATLRMKATGSGRRPQNGVARRRKKKGKRK
jgi:hypothetical protein